MCAAIACAIVFLALASPAAPGDLHKAARKGDLESGVLLIEAGTDLDAFDTMVGTPLHWAAARGHLSVAEALVEAGATLDLATSPSREFTPLQLAASAGRLDPVTFLTAQGADLTVGVNSNGTPLHLAAAGDHADTTMFLLEAGSDIGSTAKSRVGLFPLHWAAGSGAGEAVKVRLDSGASVHSVDIDGSTALHFAVFYSRLQTTRLLIEAGANPYARSTYFEPPVKLAQHHPEMAALFLSLGID